MLARKYSVVMGRRGHPFAWRQKKVRFLGVESGLQRARAGLEWLRGLDSHFPDSLAMLDRPDSGRKVHVLPKARIQDVARLAGVGLMTVSRALNKSGPVSEESRRKVYQAVAQLNYRPNDAARSLREGRSRSIGLIVPNFYDPFYAICAHAITVVANEHAYSVIVTTSDDDPEVEYRLAGSMLRRHVEGMLVIPAGAGKTKLDREEFRSTPIVALDQPIRGGQFSSVSSPTGLGRGWGSHISLSISTSAFVSWASRARLLLTERGMKVIDKQC